MLGAAKRRRIQLHFPATSVDQEAAEKAHWRNGKLSDWTLQLGQKAYPVHRYVFGQGEHNSAFLAQAFAAQRFRSTHTATTDLTKLIPSCCEGRIFEAALDFAYTGKLEDHSITLRMHPSTPSSRHPCVEHDTPAHAPRHPL